MFALAALQGWHISELDVRSAYLYSNLDEILYMVLQTHINFPRFPPIFPDFLERLSHLAPIY
jgi:hypothetical protein